LQREKRPSKLEEGKNAIPTKLGFAFFSAAGGPPRRRRDFDIIFTFPPTPWLSVAVAVAVLPLLAPLLAGKLAVQ